MSNEHWYEIVSSDTAITQGDLIFNCPILSWNPEKLNIKGFNEEEILDFAALRLE